MIFIYRFKYENKSHKNIINHTNAMRFNEFGVRGDYGMELMGFGIKNRFINFSTKFN